MFEPKAKRIIMPTQNKYQYKNPLNQGYRKIFFTKKQHNELFSKRQIRWFDKYDYYINENHFIMECSYNTLFIILATLALPFVCLLSLINTKEILKDYTRLYKQKEKGNFSADDVYSSSELFSKIKSIAKERTE